MENSERCSEPSSSDYSDISSLPSPVQDVEGTKDSPCIADISWLRLNYESDDSDDSDDDYEADEDGEDDDGDEEDDRDDEDDGNDEDGDDENNGTDNSRSPCLLDPSDTLDKNDSDNGTGEGLNVDQDFDNYSGSGEDGDDERDEALSSLTRAGKIRKNDEDVNKDDARKSTNADGAEQVCDDEDGSLDNHDDADCLGLDPMDVGSMQDPPPFRVNLKLTDGRTRSLAKLEQSSA